MIYAVNVLFHVQLSLLLLAYPGQLQHVPVVPQRCLLRLPPVDHM